MKRPLAALFACLLACATTALAATPIPPPSTTRAPEVALDVKPVIGPPANWVVALQFAPLARSAIAPGEDSRLVLSDQQINPDEHETFNHTARLVLNSAGVQRFSHYTLDFDPSYQSLILHWVRIWRGNKQLNRLDLDKIKVIQSERDLDNYLFNGTKSAVLILDDIRPGDVIDIAYSLRGHLKVLGGFADEIAMQAHEPVERLSTRLLWPPNRRLYIKNHGNIAPPVVARRGTNYEYTWDLKKVPGIASEDSLPVWYNPYPFVQISEFQTWAQVNQLAMRLFQVTNALSPDLAQKIAEWKKIPYPEPRALAAIEFVQDEIRYQGMEDGESSFIACNPSTVFERRFGDCKDKALLLVTILRALQIDAAPVLVNTRARHTLDDWQPTTHAFNHAIVQFNLNNQSYWIDATRSFQRGPLYARYLPNYERGLVLRPKTTALTVIPPSLVQSTRMVTEQFRLQGLNQPTFLNVVTVATGQVAEDLRAELATTPRAEVERAYLNYYAKLYPEVSQNAPINISDDEQQNKLEITESYSIPHMWERFSDNHPYQCQFNPANFATLLQTPSVTRRSMPLAVTFPANEVYKIEATLPGNFIFGFEDKKVDDPAFHFRSAVTGDLRKLVLQYEYKALADSVTPQRSAEYIHHLDQARQQLVYVLPAPQ